jgi:glycosyltransferase involved in cell wall biosynthesis
MGTDNLASAAGLRLVVVTETYPPEINGVARTTRDFVERLRSRGHCVQLVRPSQSGRGNGRPETGREDEILVGAVPLPKYRGLRLGLPAKSRLLGTWRKFRPHGIYVATECPLGLSALRAAKTLKIPVFSGFHTNFDAYSRYYGARLLERPIHAYLRYFHNRSTVTLTATESLKQRLLHEGFHSVEVLPRGVDTSLFHPSRRNPELRARWGVGDQDPVVLYVGRIAPEKNLELAVETFRAIREAQPGARFVLVGSGPSLESLASRCPELVFCGAHIGEDLAAHYASGDLFLFPSTSETYGNVIIEAMASGLPVVCYDYAAGRDLIRDGRNGVLARFDDPEDFVRRARSLAASPQDWQELGRNACETAAAMDWSSIHEHFVDLVRDRLPAHAPRPRTATAPAAKDGS